MLWLAAASPNMTLSGEVLRRAVTAIGKVAESDASMALEIKILTCLTTVTRGGFNMDSSGMLCEE